MIITDYVEKINDELKNKTTGESLEFLGKEFNSIDKELNNKLSLNYFGADELKIIHSKLRFLTFKIEEYTNFTSGSKYKVEDLNTVIKNITKEKEYMEIYDSPYMDKIIKYTERIFKDTNTPLVIYTDNVLSEELSEDVEGDW